MIFSVSLAQKQGRPELRLEEIMKGESFVGNLPDQIQWYNQSDAFYFNWSPGNNPSSLYCYDLKKGELKIADSGVRSSSAPVGVYDSNKSRMLYASGGNLFIKEVKSGKETQLTNTLEAISSPRFTREGKEIVYRVGTNFFRRDLQSGLVTQLTDFRTSTTSAQQPGSGFQSQAGSATGQRQTDGVAEQDRWLRAQQASLFDIFKQQRGQQFGQMGMMRGQQGAAPARAERPLAVNLDEGGAQGLDICPNGRFVTYNTIIRPSSTSRNTILPNYVTGSGYTEDINSRAKVGTPLSSSGLTVYDVVTRTLTKVGTSGIPGIRDVPEYMREYGYNESYLPEDRDVNFGSVLWSVDGRYAVVSITANDNKDRWIMSLNPETGDLTLLDRQHDEAWIGGPGISSRQMGFMPDNRRLWFQSEESGYSHLYTVDVATGEKKALTSGRFEVYNPEMSSDKKWWYFSSNEVHPGERHFYRMPLDGGTRTRITTMTGSNEVSMSPDEKWLAIRYSYSNQPWEMYVMENKPGAQAKRLTESTTAEFKAYPWRDPRVVTFTAQDGTEVYARLYKPDDNVRNGAGVIFVHGAGYLQNAHKWWSQYFREYMFNNLLADKGFTVLDIDYRGSSGYGRDCRTGIYRHMGGKDLSDHVDGAAYLVREHGVDPKRIGLYGGSYGGFITLMAMFNHPDVFAAGGALRSVTDWAHYNHGYTANILNTPVSDSIAYRRSSPIYFADGLQGALLMCHGIIDDNVHFQDIVRLTQRLIELGKDNWELAVYPVERHAFTQTSSWIDEYKRILKLFEQNLLK